MIDINKITEMIEKGEILPEKNEYRPRCFDDKEEQQEAKP